ncbi:MAG: hypothetical protein HYZ29_33645 [Myxococcales bacterium]|nr:hypothetical protein [Myxococcales bacterium]
MAKAVVVERVVACRADAGALWPLVTDTERLNRAVGLGRLALSPNDDASAARHVVTTVSGGFPLEYEERPYEWIEPTRFSVRRDVRRGLVTQLLNEFELAPRTGGGTNVTVRVGAQPKFGVIAPVLRLQVGRFVGRIADYIEQIDGALAAGGRALASAAGSVDGSVLDRLAAPYLESLPGPAQSAGKQLVDLIRSGSDVDVDRIRPFELAETWGIDRNVMLAACLHAVSAGLLELCWDLICPSCRTASERSQSLTDLGAHAHCQLCDISFDLDLDQAVEATFRPTAGIRTVDEGPYCIGGPARTPHVLAQTVLPASGQVELSAPSKPGRYRLFVRGGPAAILRVGAGGAKSLSATASATTLEPAQADLEPGARIVVSQEDPRERHVKLERVDFTQTAATAHHVSMLPEFRRQFAREVLRPGLSLRIARVALLFTDLTGSTALYTAVGDARAFRVVQAHFELLDRVVAEHSGTVVKTIGDAVMAAFIREEDAVRAGAAMHAEFRAFRRSEADAGDLSLKVGVFAGPCYVVTANGVLDYFGQTVNVAARLQGAAQGGELVLPKALADSARTLGWLDTPCVPETFAAELKGLSEPLTAARIALDRRD